MRVRAQPGGAGTVLNNLVALGVGRIVPLGFAGEDGEGFELIRAMRSMPGVRMDRFLQTPHRRTFTYCKPLVIEPGRPPRELNRLDTKNWTPTPAEVERQLIAPLVRRPEHIDALVIMDQVDLAGTGVLTAGVLEAVDRIARQRPQLRILADSRRGLSRLPGRVLEDESGRTGQAPRRRAGGGPRRGEAGGVGTCGAERPRGLRHPGGRGHAGRDARRPGFHAPALPVRGEIDIAGAGDAVTANLAAALAAGASPWNPSNWPAPPPRSSSTNSAPPARRRSDKSPQCLRKSGEVPRCRRRVAEIV